MKGNLVGQVVDVAEANHLGGYCTGLDTLGRTDQRLESGPGTEGPLRRRPDCLARGRTVVLVHQRNRDRTQTSSPRPPVNVGNPYRASPRLNAALCRMR